MIIRFLEGLFKKRNTDSVEQCVYSLEQAEDLLKRNRETSATTINKGAEPHISEINTYIREIKGKARDIAEKEIPNGLSNRIVKIIEASKPFFVESVNDSFRGVENGLDCSLDEYVTRLELALSSLLKAMTSHGRYLPAAYGEEFDVIRRTSKSIYREKKELEKLLGEKKENTAERLIGKLREHHLTAKTLTEEARNRETSVRLLETEIASLESEYRSIEETNTYRQLAGQKQKLAETEKRISDIENMVYNTLTPLKRPLRLYARESLKAKKQDAEALAKLEDYAENPDRVLQSGEDIRALLEILEKYMESSSAEKSEQEKNKTKAKVQTAKAPDYKTLNEEYAALKKTAEEIEKAIQLSRATQEKQDLWQTIEHKKREKAHKQEEIEKIMRKKSRLTEEANWIKAELEKELTNASGKRTRIYLDVYK